ncbi:hypothetical protein [Corynebacterium amycolatum]|nr:hypothetical protein [Corynebacterium amycolatum]MCQ9173644.1 hypothetical protein [Corynebacterium amycolatum]
MLKRNGFDGTVFRSAGLLHYFSWSKVVMHSPHEPTKQVGAGTPDALSENLVMLDGTMETYYISSDIFTGDFLTISE